MASVAFWVALVSSASAWENADWTWPEMPIHWCLEPGDVTAEDQALWDAALEQAWSNWLESTSCVDLVVERTDCSEDTEITFELFDDPKDNTIIEFDDGDKTHDYRINVAWAWATTEEIESGTCSDGTSIDSVLTHTIGDSLGLDHSCDEEEACSLVEAAEAVMYWSMSACEHRVLNVDDVESLMAKYGAGAVVPEGEHWSGSVTEDVCFELLGPDGGSLDGFVDATWYFAGETIEGTRACRRFEAEQHGAASVTYRYSEQCGGWSRTYAPRASFVVCEPPHAAPGAEPFGYALTPGGAVLESYLELVAPECASALEWRLLDEGGEVFLTSSYYSFEAALPERGDIEVEVIAENLAGTLESSFTIERGCGCGGGAGPGAFLPTFLALGLVRRRTAA